MKDEFLMEYSTDLNATVENVWDALTKPEMVEKYFYGTKLNTDWQVGSPITFRGSWEGNSYEDKGVVKEYEPQSHLSYSYLSSMSGKEDKPENYLRVAYKVEETDGGCRLTITQSNYDAEKMAHSRKGWKSVIDAMCDLVEK